MNLAKKNKKTFAAKAQISSNSFLNVLKMPGFFYDYFFELNVHGFFLGLIIIEEQDQIYCAAELGSLEDLRRPGCC